MEPKFTRRKYDIPSIFVNLFLIILTFLSFYPLIFTLFTSFKDNEQFFKSFWGLPNPIVFGNYMDAINKLFPYIGNSFFIASVSIIVILLFSTMSAYAFSKIKLRWMEALYLLIVALMMIPGLLQLIPRFALLKSYRLLNTYTGIILGYVAGGLPMAIMIAKATIDSHPTEIYQAARIDGASEFQSFMHITLPLIKPILGTIAIINLLSIWNDYLWPLTVLSDSNMFTISIGLIQYQSSFGATTLYGPMFAGYVIASLPLIIFFIGFMDYFMEGLTAGAIKL